MSVGISRGGQIAINVHDLDRATAFYRDKLGLSLLFTAGKLAFFDCGGVRLMLDIAEKPEFHHPSSILYSRHRTLPPPTGKCWPAECASRTSRA
jgi:catechol 2,3-dioxygenase-like lactoylglutathione lyase family enzyme